ncbi:MAG: hypothetical protein HYS36_11420, partial [Candidatus Rokubacteria bacterium]|nr:hypothetical protein [Candidatus Rokubacteria bacterium]
VWVTVKGRIVLEPGSAGTTRSYGKVDLAEFALGKQPVGTWLLPVMLGSTGGRLLRWQVPAVVQGITLEDGRAVISTR